MANSSDPLFHANWGRFVPGQVLSGRFRIEDQLGEGGMGEVYRATDLALEGNQVALKTLRSDYSSMPELARAFRGEVLKAQAVTHRNVCRIHQLEEDTSDPDDPLLYFTMELVPGQTLAQLLQQGPVAEPLATSILRQVAEGLAAAHSAEPRVIHCDLKPGNVMVELRGETDCRAVITDFGLARMEKTTSEGGTGFSTVLAGAGTRLYLAPEQVMGKSASEASDVYAFGLMAYEVLTGRLPFAGLPPDGQIASRALKAPPPASAVHPDVSAHWDALITRCLHPDPRCRPSMAEVAQDIANPVRPWWALPRLTRRQWSIAAGSTLSLVLVSLLAAAYRYWNQGRANVAPGTLIVMTPVEGLQDPPIEPVLRTALEPSPRLRLWPLAELPSVLTEMRQPPAGKLDARTWRQVARRVNSRFVVFTTLATLADSMVIQVQIEQVGDSLDRPERSWPNTFRANSRGQLLDAAAEAGRWVREQLGESTASIRETNPPTAEAMTSSWEAWKEFQRGETLAQSRKTEDEEQSAVAYDAALRHDENFALAAFRKGDYLVHVGKNQDAFAAYDQALKIAARAPMSPWWDLHYRFTLAADTDDWRRAESLARERIQKFPEHSTVFFYSAWVLLHLGHMDEAESHFLRSKQLRPARGVHTRLALLKYAVNQRSAAEAYIDQVRALGSDKWALRTQAQGEYILHDHRRALDLLQSAALTDPSRRWQSECETQKIVILADSGRTQAALDLALSSASRDNSPELRDRRAIKLMAAAWLAWELGQGSQAAVHAIESLRLDSGMPNRLHGGALLARLGRIDEARKLLADWPPLELHNYRLGRLRLQAEIESAAGNSGAAQSLIEKVQTLDSASYANAHDAWVLSRTGPWEAAVKACERVMKQKQIQAQISWPEPAGHWRRSLRQAISLSKAHGQNRPDLDVVLNASEI